MSSWATWWISCESLFPIGHNAGGRGPLHAGLHRLPGVALAGIVDQQPAGASEGGNALVDRRGGQLPQPANGTPPGGNGADRAIRRMDRRLDYIAIPNALDNGALTGWRVS